MDSCSASSDSLDDVGSSACLVALDDVVSPHASAAREASSLAAAPAAAISLAAADTATSLAAADAAAVSLEAAPAATPSRPVVPAAAAWRAAVEAAAALRAASPVANASRTVEPAGGAPPWGWLLFETPNTTERIQRDIQLDSLWRCETKRPLHASLLRFDL